MTIFIGYDASGNGNNWTANNFDQTESSPAYCNVTDTPTPYLGGGNYAVLNPLATLKGTLSDGNLKVVLGDNDNAVSVSTFELKALDKSYAEFVMTATTASTYYVGVIGYTTTSNRCLYNGSTGNKHINGVATGYGSTWGVGDVIGVAYNNSSGELTFYKNGVSQGAIAFDITSEDAFFCVYDGTSAATSTFVANFGQRPFAYTPPAGFLPLHTGNLPDSTIVDGSKHFDVVTYAGTGVTTHAITSLDFPPSLVWIKARDIAQDHTIYDQVRGVRAQLESNLTAAEVVESAGNGLVSFDSNGFTLDGDTYTYGGINSSGYNYVAWNWKANGTGVTNTAGSITSTVSANPTAGFSIVSYTGTGANATVGHGLGVAPSMIIGKRRNGIADWMVGHSNVNGGTNPFNYYMLLNTTAAQTADSTAWQNTAPTNTVFYLGSGGNVNSNGATNVMYCFAEVESYSKFGSYTGNGSADGPFVYLGFRPAFVIYKKSSASGSDWVMADNKRNTFNVLNKELYANLSAAEGTVDLLDFTSNGFKCRRSHTSQNESGQTYIYMAFAENPFKNALAR